MNNPLTDEFPITPEEFYFTSSLFNTFKRVNIAKWFKEMLHVFVKLDDPDRAILSQYSNTLETSLESTTFLYKIQIANNMKVNLPPKVVPDNIAYWKLLRSHQIWKQLEAKIQYMTRFIHPQLQYESLFDLLKDLDSDMGKNLMKGFTTNENFFIVFRDMQDNLRDILTDIEEYRSSEMVS